MDLSSVITDNIVEVLIKIAEFTHRREKILLENIVNINNADFVPMDFDVAGFADVMTVAISEHLQNERLMLCDSENIRFGADGWFEALPIVDKKAKLLFENDIREYLKLQVKKLSENLFNNEMAGELLREKNHRAQTLNS